MTFDPWPFSPSNLTYRSHSWLASVSAVYFKGHFFDSEVIIGTHRHTQRTDLIALYQPWTATWSVKSVVYIVIVCELKYNCRRTCRWPITTSQHRVAIFSVITRRLLLLLLRQWIFGERWWSTVSRTRADWWRRWNATRKRRRLLLLLLSLLHSSTILRSYISAAT